MSVKKSIINSINKLYMQFIKEYYYTKQFEATKMEVLVDTQEIAGKKIDFLLNFNKKDNGEFSYNVGAFYYNTQLNRKYRISITCTISDDFNELSFQDLNLRVKGVLHHEIEHHLQKVKFPFREKLPRKDYLTPEDYVNNPSEIEAYLKHLYVMHKKSKVNFSQLLFEEAEAVSLNEDIQLLFIKNIINFIAKRNDLNLYNNIRF